MRLLVENQTTIASCNEKKKIFKLQASDLPQKITLTHRAKLHLKRNGHREKKAECNDQASSRRGWFLRPKLPTSSTVLKVLGRGQ